MKPDRPSAFTPALFAIAFAGCALLAKSPDTAARDAHAAEVDACKLYDLLPAEKHTPATDKLCRQVRLVCQAEGGARSE